MGRGHGPVAGFTQGGLQRLVEAFVDAQADFQ